MKAVISRANQFLTAGDYYLGCLNPRTGEFITIDSQLNLIAVKPGSDEVSKVGIAGVLKKPTVAGFLRHGEWLVVADRTRLVRFDPKDYRFLGEAAIPSLPFTNDMGQEKTASEDHVVSLNVSPDGEKLLVVNASGNATLWNTADLDKPSVLGRDARLTESDALAFSPNSQILALATSDRRVEVWETASPKKRGCRSPVL